MLTLFNKKPVRVSLSPLIIIQTLAFLLGLYFLAQIHQIVIICILSFILMVALNPAVNKLEKKIKLRSVSILIVYFLVGMVAFSLLALLLPPLADQLVQLLKVINLPYLQDEISNLSFTAQELTTLADNYAGSLNVIWSVISSTLGSLFTFITLLIISFYLTEEEPRLHLKISWFTHEKKYLSMTREFLDSLKLQLGGWVRGQVILMVVIGIITYVGLSLLKIPYALPLALLAGFLEILPNLGPTLAAVPAVIIAFLGQDFKLAVWVTVFYIIVQQLENSIIVPKIMKANADVNPLVGIVSILIGFQLYNVLGGLLAIPIYIILRTIYSFWHRYQAELKINW